MTLGCTMGRERTRFLYPPRHMKSFAWFVEDEEAEERSSASPCSAISPFRIPVNGMTTQDFSKAVAALLAKYPARSLVRRWEEASGFGSGVDRSCMNRLKLTAAHSHLFVQMGIPSCTRMTTSRRCSCTTKPVNVIVLAVSRSHRLSPMKNVASRMIRAPLMHR